MLWWLGKSWKRTKFSVTIESFFMPKVAWATTMQRKWSLWEESHKLCVEIVTINSTVWHLHRTIWSYRSDLTFWADVKVCNSKDQLLSERLYIFVCFSALKKCISQRYRAKIGTQVVVEALKSAHVFLEVFLIFGQGLFALSRAFFSQSIIMWKYLMEEVFCCFKRHAWTSPSKWTFSLPDKPCSWLWSFF